jgi:hypothetical protein
MNRRTFLSLPLLGFFSTVTEPVYGDDIMVKVVTGELQPMSRADILGQCNAFVCLTLNGFRAAAHNDRKQEGENGGSV